MFENIKQPVCGPAADVIGRSGGDICDPDHLHVSDLRLLLLVFGFKMK